MLAFNPEAWQVAEPCFSAAEAIRQELWNCIIFEDSILSCVELVGKCLEKRDMTQLTQAPVTAIGTTNPILDM